MKSHHNVGGLPEDLQFELVEPLRQLFKDEVRACGLELGLPYEMVYRQPFPGPGLGVRCLGAITRDRLEAVRESDAILKNFNLPDWIRKCGNISPWYPTSSQWVCATMPVLSNGRLSSVLSIRLTR